MSHTNQTERFLRPAGKPAALIGPQFGGLLICPRLPGAAVSSCILCGLPLVEPSCEHVIPQWARREFDIQGKVTIDAREDEASTEHWQVGAMQHLNITLDDAICKDCNTVWLNRELERPLQPILAPMAGRAKPTVLSAARQSLIATWAVKTIFLLELAIRQKYPGKRRVPGVCGGGQIRGSAVRIEAGGSVFQPAARCCSAAMKSTVKTWKAV
jgi:hypothetical protein